MYGLLNVDTTRARAELAKHTTEIRMIPEASAGGELPYVAEGEWDFFGESDVLVGLYSAWRESYFTDSVMPVVMKYGYSPSVFREEFMKATERQPAD